METLLIVEKNFRTYYLDKINENIYQVSRDEKVLKTFKSLEKAIRFLNNRTNKK